MFRVGIIGCGGISAVHAKVILDLEDTTLVACADILSERANAMADQYGCAAFEDYRRMLEEAKLDAVHICAPHYLHPEMVQEAANRGIAAFTEKPPAIDAEGWKKVLHAVKLVPVGICFQNRYNPNVLTCRKLVESGEYGVLRGIRAFVTWNRTPEYYAAADWKGRWATEGGGALINQAIHTLDLVLCFLGAPDQAEAAMTDHHLKGAIEVEDTAEIYLRKGDVPALIYASTAYSQDAPVMIELHLEKAVLRLEGDGITVFRDGKKEEISCETDPALGRSYWGAGHRACIADFYRCVSEGLPFPIRPDACGTTMDVLFRLYGRSGENGK